jgi:XTP/dITP diphosphohydrolase
MELTLDKHKKIVLATSNAGKIKELAALLQPFNMDVVTQSVFKIEDADETGLTYIENALIKARHAARLSGLPALADDSGLSVQALKGAPGIRSARYAGDNANSDENIEKLLTAMHDIPDDQRQAQFHCVLALLQSADDPTPIICHGTWSGTILRAPRGEHGFGYDPIFYIPSLMKSAAEIEPLLKYTLSHRGVALKKLTSLLADNPC